MIKIIAAVTTDMGLGRRGQLLYHISADLKNFKALTMGHPIVMGRNTFESFPNGALPGRRNIVITSTPHYIAPDIEVFPSLESAIEAAGNDCFVIGGGRVYHDAFPLADELYLTHINALSPDGTDTYFPTVNPSEWQLAEQTDPVIDPRSGVSYHFARYRRMIPVN